MPRRNRRRTPQPRHPLPDTFDRGSLRSAETARCGPHGSVHPARHDSAWSWGADRVELLPRASPVALGHVSATSVGSSDGSGHPSTPSARASRRGARTPVALVPPHGASAPWSGAQRRPSNATAPFVIYVEGASDRGVLEAWARRVSGRLARVVADSTVILGGRKTRRAARELRGLRRRHGDARGICILDRDALPVPEPSVPAQPGLEVWVWPRRHIESYLLVEAAIRRALRVPDHDMRATVTLRRLLPAAHDDETLRRLDAKALLSPRNELAIGLKRSPRAISIARAMRLAELHPDVLRLLDRIRILAEPPSRSAGLLAARRDGRGASG